MNNLRYQRHRKRVSVGNGTREGDAVDSSHKTRRRRKEEEKRKKKKKKKKISKLNDSSTHRHNQLFAAFRQKLWETKHAMLDFVVHFIGVLGIKRRDTHSEFIQQNAQRPPIHFLGVTNAHDDFGRCQVPANNSHTPSPPQKHTQQQQEFH
jgi:hypothetical protein